MFDDAPVARDTLIGRERIRGASRMIPEGTDAASVTPEQIATVVSDVTLFLNAHKKSIDRAAVAKAIGYSPGVVSEFLNGKYGGKAGQVAIDLEAWLVEEEQRRQRPSTTQFVWSNVAEEIKATASYCVDYQKIGLVYGPDTSGIGKTTALQAIHQELGPRRSTLVTIDKVDANPTALLRKITAAMRLTDGSRTIKGNFDKVVTHLSGRSHLLLIDQIHNLRGAKEDKPFYVLTDLYDATKTAQLWCGTADLVAYLDRQRTRQADESLAQIRSRIMPCVDLMQNVRPGGGGDGGNGEPLVTVEQVREMFGKNKLKLSATAARWLCALANEPDTGGLRLCVQLVEYATMLGGMQRSTSIDTALLKVAMRRAFSPARAEVLLGQAAAAEAAPSRAARAG
jgi:DNA transposition AAA+ family ATPase